MPKISIDNIKVALLALHFQIEIYKRDGIKPDQAAKLIEDGASDSVTVFKDYISKSIVGLSVTAKELFKDHMCDKINNVIDSYNITLISIKSDPENVATNTKIDAEYAIEYIELCIGQLIKVKKEILDSFEKVEDIEIPMTKPC